MLPGSALLFLIKEVTLRKAEANLATIWKSVQTLYRTHKTKNRVGRLTLKMLEHQPFPWLSAKTVETRDLLPALGKHSSRVADKPPVHILSLFGLPVHTNGPDCVGECRASLPSLADHEALRAATLSLQPNADDIVSLVPQEGGSFCSLPSKTTRSPPWAACLEDRHQPKWAPGFRVKKDALGQKQQSCRGSKARRQ